jgi:hypothetical protein
MQKDLKQNASTPASGSVRVGDRYHRSDNRATTEVMRVTDTHVECECVQDGDSWRFTATLEEFRRLEATSLEWGAVFEPAPENSIGTQPE